LSPDPARYRERFCTSALLLQANSKLPFGAKPQAAEFSQGWSGTLGWFVNNSQARPSGRQTGWWSGLYYLIGSSYAAVKRLVWKPSGKAAW